MEELAEAGHTLITCGAEEAGRAVLRAVLPCEGVGWASRVGAARALAPERAEWLTEVSRWASVLAEGDVDEQAEALEIWGEMIKARVPGDVALRNVVKDFCDALAPSTDLAHVDLVGLGASALTNGRRAQARLMVKGAEQALLDAFAAPQALSPADTRPSGTRTVHHAGTRRTDTARRGLQRERAPGCDSGRAEPGHARRGRSGTGPLGEGAKHGHLVGGPGGGGGQSGVRRHRGGAGRPPRPWTPSPRRGLRPVGRAQLRLRGPGLGPSSGSSSRRCRVHGGGRAVRGASAGRGQAGGGAGCCRVGVCSRWAYSRSPAVCGRGRVGCPGPG